MPVAKVSFSSQEWCGHVWHQIVRAPPLDGLFHSYFEARPTAPTRSRCRPTASSRRPAILVRGWNGALLAPGQSRTVPSCVPPLARILHRRSPGRGDDHALRVDDARRGSAGAFEVSVYDVAVEAGRKLSFAVEAAPPFRLVRQTGADGEELQLEGSTRLSYWQSTSRATRST